MIDKGFGQIMLKSTNKEKGFTIIEVVLVLAIAGLIFLVVFLALPALQKSQRDTARRQDVGKVVAGLQQYMADNGNRLPPAGWTGGGYTSGLAQAKSIYTRAATQACQRAPAYGGTNDDWIIITSGCTCSQISGTPVANARFANIRMALENGGQYCQDL
jgi:prepilin-type N-terminal cleavage/methylation domain-containing protein